MIKLEVSSEFWKMYIHYHDEPDSFQIPKHFSDEIGSNINKCDLSFFIMKCANVLKSVWLSQPIFSKDKHICHKIMHE